MKIFKIIIIIIIFISQLNIKYKLHHEYEQRIQLIGRLSESSQNCPPPPFQKRGAAHGGNRPTIKPTNAATSTATGPITMHCVSKLAMKKMNLLAEILSARQSVAMNRHCCRLANAFEV